MNQTGTHRDSPNVSKACSCPAVGVAILGVSIDTRFKIELPAPTAVMTTCCVREPSLMRTCAGSTDHTFGSEDDTSTRTGLPGSALAWIETITWPVLSSAIPTYVKKKK